MSFLHVSTISDICNIPPDDPSSSNDTDGVLPESYMHAFLQLFQNMSTDELYDISKALHVIYGYDDLVAGNVSNSVNANHHHLDVNEMPLICRSETATLVAFIETELSPNWLLCTDVSTIDEAIESVLLFALTNGKEHETSVIIIDFHDSLVCCLIATGSMDERLLSFSIIEDEGHHSGSRPTDNILVKLCGVMKEIDHDGMTGVDFQESHEYGLPLIQTAFSFVVEAFSRKFENDRCYDIFNISFVLMMLNVICDTHMYHGTFRKISKMADTTKSFLHEARFNLSLHVNWFADYYITRVDYLFERLNVPTTLYELLEEKFEVQGNNIRLKDPIKSSDSYVDTVLHGVIERLIKHPKNISILLLEEQTELSLLYARNYSRQLNQIALNQIEMYLPR